MEENKNPEENIEEQSQEKVDQDKLAEEWASMAENPQEETEEVDQEKLAEEWAKAAKEAEPVEENLTEEVVSASKETESLAKGDEKLEIFMDIPLEVSVEIGQTELPLEEILRLAPNSIVELDKLIEQPVDLKINGRLVAKGELYTVDNNFAIRITNIITAQERLRLFTEDFE